MDSLRTWLGDVRTAVAAVPGRSLWAMGAIFWAGSLLVGGVNYLFNIVMAREAFLGPAGFGALAALSSLIYLDGIVATALTTAMANQTAALAARRESARIAPLLRVLSVRTGEFGLLAALLFVLASPLVARFLHLPSVIPVLVLAPSLVAALLLAVTLGALQGLLLFPSLAFVAFLGAVLRLVFSVLLVLRGFGVSGALLGGLIAVLLAWVVSFLPLRHALVAPRAADEAEQRRREEAPPLRDLSSAVGVALLAVAGLTALFSVDVVLAKHYLSAEEAGLYGGLSTLGRVVYFVALPLTLLMFPIITRRFAGGEPVRRILLLSGGGTLAVGAVVVGCYALVPARVIQWTIGTPYLPVASSLWLVGLFFASVSLVGWLTYVALALRRTMVALLPIGGALLQVLLIARFHASVRAVLLASLAAAGLLVGALAVGLLLTKASERRSAYSKGSTRAVLDRF